MRADDFGMVGDNLLPTWSDVYYVTMGCGAFSAISAVLFAAGRANRQRRTMSGGLNMNGFLHRRTTPVPDWRILLK
jgi:hypothetical protein